MLTPYLMEERALGSVHMKWRICHYVNTLCNGGGVIMFTPYAMEERALGAVPM